MNSTDWRERRKQAAWRKRRIIYNNDGNDATGNNLLDGAQQPDDLVRAVADGEPEDIARLATPEVFWAERCAGIEETDVDSIFYNTTMGFNQHTHDSKVAEVSAALATIMRTECDLSAVWIEQGRDGLQLTIDFCRKHEKEIFWSLRMNDGHDNWYPSLCPEFKKQHPEMLLFQSKDIGRVRSGPDWPEPYLYARAVDYARQEIRDQQFATTEDVCRRYDVDGIELDFLRNPIFFRPTLECRPCETEHLEIMTGFMRRLREMTEEVGRERDRPLLIACRVPSQIDCCRKVGLDIERWLADDLIDVVVSSLENDSFTGPVHELADLGHRCNAPVYACLSSVQFGFSGIDPSASWAGAATNAWNAGVDGIYTFNADPRLPECRAIGDPARLAKMDKVFGVDNLDKERCKEHVYPREGRLPVDLSPGEVRSIVLPVGDDIAARAGNGEVRHLILRIYVDRMTYSDEVEFKLNGQVLETDVYYATDGVSPVVCSNFLLRARPEPGNVRKGDNQFTALLKKRCDSAPGVPAVTGLQLVVKYKR